MKRRVKKMLLFIFLPVYAFKLGVENISPEVLKHLQSGTVGLVTNQTGVDQSGRNTFDLLRQKGIAVSAIYVPEHGMNGSVLAGEDVKSTICDKNQVPIISLYAHGAGRIDSGAFDAVDMLVVDLQDVGMRHYTYISTLYKVMEKCAHLKKPVVVLDRPNLLGSVMEGPICASQLRSFIGIAEIPLRHGMTIGELAQFFNEKSLTHKIDLTVVPLAGYRRDMLPSLLSHLSPNIKTLDSVYGYSFLGLVGEVSPFNVGVGTDDAFRIITLPAELGITDKAWCRLRQDLEQFGICATGINFFHAAKKKEYEGLKLSFDNMNAISGFKALMSVLSWTKEQKVHVDFAPTFDKSVGTQAVRDWYQTEESSMFFMQNTKRLGQEFLDFNKGILLYQPFPKVVYKQLCDIKSDLLAKIT